MLVESRWGRMRIASRDGMYCSKFRSFFGCGCYSTSTLKLFELMVDSTGLWEYTNVPNLTSAVAPIPKYNASFVKLPTQKNRLAKIGTKVLPSLLLVEWHSPLGIDGVNCKWADGIGIVIDAKSGLVLVDRAT